MKLSVSTRILLSFLFLLLAFTGAAAFAVVRMRSTSADLRVLGRGHLRLAFALSEIEALQSSLVHLVGDGQTLGLAALRRMRLRELAEARRIARAALKLDPRDGDVAFLRRMARDLRTLETACLRSENAFEALFGAAAASPPSAAAVSALGQREGEVLRLVRAARDLAKGRATELALDVERVEATAVWGALGLVVAALGVGVTAAAAASRTLRPLRGLAAGARAIAGGDYALRVEVGSPDEIGRLAAEFNHMAAALEEREQRLVRSERLAAAGRVAGHVAHEIRNPLSAIGLDADLLEEEVGDKPEARRLLARIRGEIDRLESLTEEYLRFGRLPQPRLEREELPRIVRGVLELVDGELRASSIAVRAELRDVPPIAADEAQLRQALLNLVRNAREAMAGGGTLSVETDTSVARDSVRHVEVRVSDTGPGMPPEVAGRLFEPFFTTKARGTGLGLALTHQIVADHGGRIEVRTAPGRGTTFVISLPAA
ncbi:MAG: ATP-binding protein [Myxococcota bacterium]